MQSAAAVQGCRSGRSAAQGCRQLSLSRSPRVQQRKSTGVVPCLRSKSVASCGSREHLLARSEEARALRCKKGALEGSSTRLAAAPAEAEEAEALRCKKGAQEGPSARPAAAPEEASPEQLRRWWEQKLPSGGTGPRAVFLDYDGTLREFEARPEQAVPTPEITALLTALNAREDLAPHIISGRDCGFLESHLRGLDRFTLVAEHGYKLRRPGCGWEYSRKGSGDEEQQRWKAILRPVILRAVEDLNGSHLEEKASSLVWHYREAAAEAGGRGAEELMAHLEQLRAREGLGDVRITHGAKIVEVSYRGVDKGAILRSLCEERRQAGRPFEAVLAAGDDRTDEFMFASAPPGSMTIKVGTGDSQAKFRIGSPRELRSFLRCIATSPSRGACSAEGPATDA